MTRRGRCRCGFVLKFHHGIDGYKTRCPECGAVVRLRSKGRKKVRLRSVTCACGYKVLLAFDSASAVCPSCSRTVRSAEPPAADASPRGTTRSEDERPKAGAHTAKKRRRQRAGEASAAPVAKRVGPSRLSKPRPQVATAVACSKCSTMVPASAAKCPACGALVVRSPEAAAPLGSSGPRATLRVQPANYRLRMILSWLGAVGALLIVAGIILVLLLWK